ncbi:MAG: hypothetical protein M1511_03280 [Deltaproteobacteria bacterium]|nr:hypothetical protein [Deltaproteobacteria bacterium]
MLELESLTLILRPTPIRQDRLNDPLAVHGFLCRLSLGDGISFMDKVRGVVFLTKRRFVTRDAREA